MEPLTPAAVDAAEFSTVRVKRGYDMQSVDAFMDLAESDLQIRLTALDGMRAGADPAPLHVALTDAQVRGTRFPKVRLHEGYDVAEVDAFVALIAERYRDLDYQLTRHRVRVVSRPEIVTQPASEPAQPAVTPNVIDAVQFTTTRVREGYDMQEVDEFLDIARRNLQLRLDARTRLMAGDTMTSLGVGLRSDHIDTVEFTTVRLREGYDMQEVDEFLSALIEEFRALDDELARRGVRVDVLGGQPRGH